MPSRSSSSSRSSGSASGTRARTRPARLRPSRPLDAGGRAQQPRHHMKRDVGWRAIRRRWKTPRHHGAVASAATSRTRRLLPMPGGPTTPTTAPWPSIARSSTPSTAAISHRRPTRVDSSTPDAVAAVGHAQQPPGRHRFVGTLDAHQLRFAEHRGALDQPRGGLAEHHPTRRCHRLHPLRHPDLLTDGGVTQSARTDLTGDHLTGIQAHPQLQVDTVAALRPRRPAAWPPPGCPAPPGRHERRGPPTPPAHRTPP